MVKASHAALTPSLSISGKSSRSPRRVTGSIAPLSVTYVNGLQLSVLMFSMVGRPTSPALGLPPQ